MVEKVSNDTYLEGLTALGANYASLHLPESLKNGTQGYLDFLYSDPDRQTADAGAFDKFSGLLARAAVSSAMYSYNWNSPFEQFVQDLPFGNGKILTAMETPEVDSFDAHRSDLLVRDFGQPHQAFIPLDFSPRKTISISSTTIRTSLLTNGDLAQYVNTQTDTITNADRIATYARFKQELVNALRSKHKPVPNVHIHFDDPLHPTDKELEELSILSRKYAQQMSVAPSALYNMEHLTTISSPDALVAYLVPALNANMSVKVLANAFHVDMTGINSRAIYLDDLGMSGLYMVMADRAWLNEYRQLRTIQAMPFDPSTQSFNLSLVHRAAIGVNPFKNAISFSEAETTLIDQITVVPPTSIEASCVADDGTPVTEWDPEDPMPLHLRVTPKGGSITPDTARFALPVNHVAEVTSDTPGAVKATTYVDNFDTFHWQRSPKLKDGTKLTITVRSTANDDQSGDIETERAKEPLTATATLTIKVGHTTVTPAPSAQDDSVDAE